MNLESVWSAECRIEKRERLKGDHKTDVLVIGAGMAGILTAYLLQKQGKKVIVLEAERIASGVSRNTTAKITSQHGLIYDGLIRKMGLEYACGYAQANQKAIVEYSKIIRDEGISCHLENKNAFVYLLEDRKKLQLETEAAERAGIEAVFTEQTELPFKVAGAVKFSNQAQFHPLEFIRSVSAGLCIYEESKVIEVHGKCAKTAEGSVSADSIVVTTHYPFIDTPGYYFMRMHQERSYVLALENAAVLNGMYIDGSGEGYSFRNYGKLLLLGGEAHRTGKNPDGGCYQRLSEAAQRFYPDSREVYRWSAQDCMTLDQVPYIGQYSTDTPDMYVATGFQKWGMTTSMVAAMLLRDLILGKKNDYAFVFTPQRFRAAASATNLAKDAAQSVSGLTKGLLKVPDTWEEELHPGTAGIVESEQGRIGVYKDQEGNCFRVSAKCPHLGCLLAWNPDELSWDCPCHGSRFDYRGQLISGPAMEGIALD
jgi:glycine/D-amino acid oxidase-like deaminating enzyme/nitrite reductase/ring-hydroxylating ferredoxin subunit